MLIAFMTMSMAADPAVSGTWVLDQPEAEVAAVHEQTVQTTLDSLPWAIRGFARRPLTKTVDNCPHLTIDLQSSELVLHCKGKDPATIERPSQGRVTTGEDGNPVTIDLETAASWLSVRFATEDGGVTTRYATSGEHLVVTKSLFSPRLDAPVEWVVRYRRSDSQ